jgi:hypothetical protein
MSLVQAINAIRYTTRSSISANPNWTAPNSFTQSVTVDRLPVPEVGEKWFEHSRTSSGESTLITTVTGTEIEASFAVFQYHYAISGAPALFTLKTTTSTGDVGVFRFNAYYQVPRVEVNGADTPAGFVTNMFITRGVVSFYTFRLKYGSSGTSVIQIFLNGVLLYELAGALTGPGFDPTTILQTSVEFNASDFSQSNHMMVFDAWTTPLNTVPSARVVVEDASYGITTSVVPFTYFNNEPSPTPLLSAFAAEGYETPADMLLNPYVKAVNNNLASTAIVLIDEPPTDQRWFTPTQSGANIDVWPVLTERLSLTTPALEMSFAFTTSATTTGSPLYEDMMSLQFGTTANYYIRLSYDRRTGGIRMTYPNTAGTAATNTIYTPSNRPAVNYITLRLVGNTLSDGFAGASGVIELWLNGVMMLQTLNNNWAGGNDESLYYQKYIVVPRATINWQSTSTYFNHIIFRRELSTPIGTEPAAYAITNDGAASNYTPIATEVGLDYFGQYLRTMLGFSYMSTPSPGII